jgi:hypothetical protein
MSKLAIVAVCLGLMGCSGYDCDENCTRAEIELALKPDAFEQKLAADLEESRQRAHRCYVALNQTEIGESEHAAFIALKDVCPAYDTNTTTIAHGTHKQVVFLGTSPRSMLYFDNGRLVAKQISP